MSVIKDKVCRPVGKGEYSPYESEEQEEAEWMAHSDLGSDSEFR